MGVLHLRSLWFGLLQAFLNEQLSLGSTVYVAIDRTTWRDINLLMASIVWKGRAIPLYWQRLDSLGNSHYDKQTAFLAVALPLLTDYRVVLLGDREFCSVDLARWLGQRGHYFCLRQKRSTYVLIEDKPWLKLSQLDLAPGTQCFYNAVTMTKSKGFGSAHLAGKWKRRYRGFASEEPWFLLTNLESLDNAVAAYQKRFDIEEMFRDFKLGGYRLEDCRASRKRFLAIVLLIAIAYLCASTRGQRLKQKALQKYIARPETAGRSYRRHSFFHVGLAAHRWMPFWQDSQQQVQQLMMLNRGKIEYYLRGQKAMMAVLQTL
ncbi:IS4 family transposase [cf. Phormidesmis sp. LEGE 11477]|uniref:IS4 family transposase n=1 Tax=cf. Phormidesmis sp. LEGE 11477 TaxID=1828680 RepID=UPI001D137D8B